MEVAQSGIITVVVDNATSTDGTVTLATSASGTHTIEYRAYDQSGLMGTATRTIIVSAPTAQRR